MKSLLITITIGMTMLLPGCAGVFLVGAGVGAGAFSYIAGNLTRVYEADYQQSIKASINMMEQHNFKRKEESEDELKTIIEGYLNYDTPVTIEVVYVAAGWTQISVRIGYVGVDNLEMSKQVHADIAEEYKRLKPRTIRATSKKKSYKPADDKAKAPENVVDFPPPMSETVSVPLESDIDDTQEMRERQEKQALYPTEWQQEMRERQEKQALYPTESINKTLIYYPKSTLTIHSGSYGALDDVISYLDKNPSARVDIRDYTYSSGNIARNLALSRKRVSEIRNYLILHDISEEIITTQELGATNFLESNRTEGLKSLNPYVEITIK